MANNDGGGLVVLAQMIGRANQVLDIRGKARVLEFTIGRSKPRKIEAQHRYAETGQRCRDVAGGENIFGAGEAVSKKRIGTDTRGWHIQSCGQLMPNTAREGHAD